MTPDLLERPRALLLVLLLGMCLACVTLPAVEALPEPLAPAAPTSPLTTNAPPQMTRIIGEGENLWDLFRKGGICMWPILACAVVGLAFFFERLIEGRRARQVPAGFDKEVVLTVDRGGVDAGLALCLERPSALARVLYAALLRYGATRQDMEAAIRDESGWVLYDLRRNCRVIGIMSRMAPMWGLLGTVQGLVLAFDALAGTDGLPNAERLSSGVAIALLTTAFGLAVAIPLLALYHYAKGRVDDVAREVEERAVDAIVALGRKARLSIRQIEDVEENLETKTMAAARAPLDLDAQLQDQDLEKAIKTSLATPAQLLVPQAATASKPPAPVGATPAAASKPPTSAGTAPTAASKPSAPGGTTPAAAAGPHDSGAARTERRQP